MPDADTELRKRVAEMQRNIDLALASLDAAVATVATDTEAALDDLLAARLLLLIALAAV